jgi:ribosome maturation factor RimP
VDEALFDLLAPTVEALGLELVEAEVRTGLVKVVVDREGGADLESISETTRAVSSFLDRSDPLPGRRYTLEVSSPGVERALRTPRHFARAVGEVVSVRTVSGSEGERRVQGRLVEADDDGFVLDLGSPAGPRSFSYGEIERARTVFEWPPSNAPGTRAKAKRHQHRSRAGKNRQEPAATHPDAAEVTTR